MQNVSAQNAITTLQAAQDAVAKKQQVLMQRQKEETKIKKQLANIDDDGELVSHSGCGLCTLLFGKASKYSAPTELIKRNKATTQLQVAVEELQRRAESLQERVDTARSNAATLNSCGKKTEALAALRRSKMLEKQLASSQSALETLEGQLLLLEEAKLQSEISSALTASTGAVKKKTRGLVGKTEKAVDAAVEVRDMAEDVSAAMEGLRPVETLDEDDLLAELEAMVEPPFPPVAAAVTGVEASPGLATVTVSFPSVPSAKVATSRPEVPSRRLEKQGLLASQTQ